MKTNILANIFSYIREVIEEMDSPLSLMFLVMLPIIVPITPAYITATNLVSYMNFRPEMGLIIGISVEMLGYGGLVTLLSVITEWLRTRKKETLSLIYLVGAGYLVYILSLLSINVILDADAGNRLSHVIVMGLLTVGLSLAAGIFNGYRIAMKQQEEADAKTKKEMSDAEDKKRREDNEFKLAKLRIKHGATTGNATLTDVPEKEIKVKHASDYRDKILQMLNEAYSSSGKVLSPKDITTKLKLEHSKNKGYVSTLTKTWKRENGIQ